MVWPLPGIPSGHNPPVFPKTSMELVGDDALIVPWIAGLSLCSKTHRMFRIAMGGFAGRDWMNRDFKLWRKGMTEPGHAFFILFPD